MIDPTTRFTDKAKYYHSSRPGYPIEILTTIKNITNLPKDSSFFIADIGSGTGKLSEIFLNYGVTVFGVEPNTAMRNIAKKEMSKYQNFISINGTAESTNLKDHSIDIIVAGQSFHWFDLKEAKKEFLRILKPDGYVFIIWNNRNKESSFFRDYENILNEFGTDYQEVKNKNITKTDFIVFFGTDNYKRILLDNKQFLNFEGLRCRLLSTSYIPSEEDKCYPKMLETLQQLFRQYERNKRVELSYQTEIFGSRLL